MSTSTRLGATLTLAAVLVLSACGAGRTEVATSAAAADDAATGFPPNAVIGVALPQKTSENWVLAEQLFNEGLTDAGFTPSVQFANGGVTDQQNQIQAMAAQGAKVIIVGSIDGSQLGTQLADAKQSGAFIMAYERALTNTPDVDFKIGFDAYQVGVLQGQSLLEGLARRAGAGPHTIELIAGSPDDASSKNFFDGAMSVLKPELEDGTLRILSGQADFQQVVTQGWKTENVQKRFDSILSSSYQSADLDGILSPNDTLARAAMASVGDANKPLPVVTGQDSEIESVKSIMAGEQYSTIYKDTRALVARTISFVKDLQQGRTLPTNTEPADNGSVDVPSYLIPPIIVTEDNAAEVYAKDPTLAPLTVP